MYLGEGLLSEVTAAISSEAGNRYSCPTAVIAQYERRRLGRIDPRSQVSVASSSPQFSNFRVGPQLPLHIVTAGPEDDASGAAGLELDETFAQLLASACEGHLFGGGHVDERVMTVRNVEVMTAVNGEVASVFAHPFDAGQPRFAVRQRFHAFRIGRVPVVIGKRDERFEGGRGARRGDVLSIIEGRAAGRPEAGIAHFDGRAEV